MFVYYKWNKDILPNDLYCDKNIPSLSFIFKYMI